MTKYLISIFLIVLTVFFCFRLKDSYQSYQALKEEYLKLEKRKNYLVKEKEILENNLTVDKEKALEREARVMMGLKKEGEKVIMIIPPKDFSFDNSLEKNNSLNANLEKISFFKKICYYLYEFFKGLNKRQ